MVKTPSWIIEPEQVKALTEELTAVFDKYDMPPVVRLGVIEWLRYDTVSRFDEREEDED